MRFECKLLIGAGAIVAVAGCAPVDPGMGEALRYDMAAQTIDPDPVYPDDGAKPGDSGDHGVKAVERYRKGTVKDVQAQSTGSGPN